MSNSTLHIRRNAAIGDLANSLGVSVPRFMQDFVLPAVRDAASATFAAGRRDLARWVALDEPGPARHRAGEIDVAPPIPAGAAGELDEAQAYAAEQVPNAAIAGLHWKISDQQAAVFTIDSLARQGADIGRALALSAEQAVSEELEGITFTAAQRQAAALTASALTAALGKLEVLRGPNGGFPPAPAVLLLAGDLGPTYADIWPAGIPGLAVSIARTLPAGRWYVAPAPSAAVLNFDVSESLAIRATDTTPTASAGLVITCATSENPLILRAADGSARWIVQGGV